MEFLCENQVVDSCALKILGQCVQVSARVRQRRLDRKSTRLNSSHLVISYAVFCLKKKIKSMCSFCACCLELCSCPRINWTTFWWGGSTVRCWETTYEYSRCSSTFAGIFPTCVAQR